MTRYLCRFGWEESHPVQHWSASRNLRRGFRSFLNSLGVPRQVLYTAFTFRPTARRRFVSLNFILTTVNRCRIYFYHIKASQVYYQRRANNNILTEVCLTEISQNVLVGSSLVARPGRALRLQICNIRQCLEQCRAYFCAFWPKLNLPKMQKLNSKTQKLNLKIEKLPFNANFMQVTANNC